MLIVYLEFAALRIFYFSVDHCSYITYLLICLHWFDRECVIVYILQFLCLFDFIWNVLLYIFCVFLSSRCLCLFLKNISFVCIFVMEFFFVLLFVPVSFFICHFILYFFHYCESLVIQLTTWTVHFWIGFASIFIIVLCWVFVKAIKVNFFQGEN